MANGPGMRNVSGASLAYSPNLLPTRISVRSSHRNKSNVSSCSTRNVETRAMRSAVASWSNPATISCAAALSAQRRATVITLNRISPLLRLYRTQNCR